MISDARKGHVSPGIYTEERDVTYSVKSLGITSLGLVGETLYGPAFQNVEITNWGEFVDYFGGTSPEKFKNDIPKYELPFIAKSYLEESKNLNVVRVLGLSGYDAGKVWVIKNGEKAAIILRSKKVYGDMTNICEEPKDGVSDIVDEISIIPYVNRLYSTNCAGINAPKNIDNNSQTFEIPGKFGLKVKLTDKSEKLYYVSLNPSDSDYIYNVLSNRPDTGTTPIYIESVYESSLFNGNEYFTPNKGVVTLLDNKEYSNFREGYRAAMTPWIVSDASINMRTNEDGSEESEVKMRKLFRFITISDGDASNTQVKVSIQNIDVHNATFDVVVHDFYDSDASPMILENFRKCNLVEGDVNYIAYKIGTSDGGYVSKSKYIVVEMAESEDLSNSFPAGFMGYPMPTYGASENFEMLYNTDYNASIKAKRQYFGISDITGIDKDVFAYKGKEFYNIEPKYTTNGFHMDSLIMPDSYIDVDGETGFTFTSVSQDKKVVSKYIPRLINASYINETLYGDIKTRKFTVCFYGGFDGWDVNREKRTNTDEYKSTKYNMGDTENPSKLFDRVQGNDDLNLPLNLPNTAITSDYYAYLAGVRVFANPQDVDINLLATPGLNWYDNALLTQEIIEVIEDSEDGRGGDTLYIMAAPNTVDIADVCDSFESLEFNSSYACTYFPWIMHYDNTNKRYLNLPVTKDVVKNMAAIDNRSFPWFAPAGTERGNVNCIKAMIKTTLADEDKLYEVGINPVKTFAKDGVKIWGNKTAYPVESPLNRINVRRLMIRVKKLITDAARHLIFEQYDETLEKQFRGLVEPILADVKANRGIIDYRIITESTPETRDQHILPAKILIKPTQALEYISISFTVYPESVNFDEN